MKLARLVAIVLCACAWSASMAFAGGDACAKGAHATAAKPSCSAHATTTAATAACTGTCSTTGAPCTAEQRAKCTPEMRAACSKGASASAANAKGTSCCASGASAANAKGTSCCAGGASATNAKGTSCCAGGAAMMHDCSVCSDEATCDNELRAAGVRSQVVGLRNGAMIVYTADTPEGVRALQATVARYNDHIMSAYSSGAATLCGGCKSFRGAMASGKFTRELVNVKTGCQILLTSTDKNMVRRIHDMTGAQVASREHS